MFSKVYRWLILRTHARARKPHWIEHIKRPPAFISEPVFVSGRSKPARKGRMKTSHFEGRVASRAASAAQGRDESTQREPATFDINFGWARLVGPADCPRVGPQP